MAMKFDLMRAATGVGVGVVDELVEKQGTKLPSLGPVNAHDALRYIAAIGGQFFGGDLGEDVSIAAIPLATKSLLKQTKVLGASNWVPSGGPWGEGVSSRAGMYRPIS